MTSSVAVGIPGAITLVVICISTRSDNNTRSAYSHVEKCSIYVKGTFGTHPTRMAGDSILSTPP